MEDSSIPKQELDAVECINTGRSIKHYLENLNLSKNDLEKCDFILDIGSGIEQRFARDCKEMGIKATVVSIDPGILFPEKNDLRYLTSKDEITRRRTARNKPEKETVSAIAQHLPFKENSFDMVLALYSVPLYISQESDVSLSFTEILRVLKNDGQARIYPITKESKEIDDFIQQHKDITFDKVDNGVNPDSYLLIITKTKPLAPTS